MNSVLDPQTKKFYIEMGYSEQQVLRAYEYSKKNNIDILDALSMNLPSSQSQAQPNTKQQNINVMGTKSQQKDKYSLLIPFSKVKGSEYEVLYSRSSKQNQLNSKYELREVNNPVGLLNISNCCYLNSLLQCYFLMNDFKVALLTAEPLVNLEEILGSQSKTKLKRITNQYELLKKLKSFFTLMFLTSKKYLDPSQVLQNLVDSVGEKISYGEEKDLSEINIMIIERLSEGLTYSQKYYKEEASFAAEDQSMAGSIIIQGQKKAKFNSMFNPKEGVIKRLFYGTKVQYYQDTNNLQKEAPIVSDFTGIILNPHFGTLSLALDQQFNFSVQINGSTFNKQIFIRDEPQYLFMYINRTNFDREEGQMLKNEQKFTFDFVIYMDRYLQKYRKEKDMKNERVKELTVNKNKIKQQMDDLQILFKKMEECYRYIAKLQGWAERLPKQQEFNQEYAKLDAKLNQIQTELKQIESRKQQYHLMYIFVHRGDAASGHYWGYGRNDDKWYRFDINCRKIDQQQIIIDMDKSSATPYALLYVKQRNIPKFDYQHHMNKFNYQNKHQHVDFRSCFDQKLSEEIIRQNMLIHQQVLVRSNQVIKKKVYVDYVNRFNAVKKVTKKYREGSNGKQMAQIDIYNNFSLFLYFRKEYELCNFSIFQQSLLLASNNKITIDKLIHESDLLSRIQKKFKKRCRGQYYLKHYALLSEERERYGQLLQAYHLSVFQIIWGTGLMFEHQNLVTVWENNNIKYSESQKLNGNSILKTRIQNIFRLLQIRGNLIKSQQWKRANQILNQPLYITQVNQQITKLMLLKLAVWGIKIQSVPQFIDFNDVFASQIVIINAANTLQLQKNDSNNLKTSPITSAIEFINEFYMRGSKFTQSDISAKSSIERRSSAKAQTSSQKQILSTPTKSGSNSRQSLSMSKRVSQSKLSYPADIRSVLAVKETWRLQQLDKIQINYGYSDKLMVFLKQMTKILAVYKKILNQNKAYSLFELRKEVELNQGEEQQSLI